MLHCCLLQDEGVLETLRRDLEEASGQRDALVAELRAHRATEDTQKSIGAAVDVLVGDAMAGAREAALEREVEGLRIDLEAALADAVELAKNPAWETEVPADEWEAMLEEKEACLEGLLEERAAMEEHIASVEGEKAALERRVGALEGEKKAVQGQMNMLMISSSDSENRLHELEVEKEELLRKLEGGASLAQEPGSDRLTSLERPVGTASSLGEDNGGLEGESLPSQLQGQTTEELRRLEQLVSKLEGERDEAVQQLGAAEQAATGGCDMVSMAVLEDFREQQMEDRAEWEAEKARLEEELARLRAGGAAGAPKAEPAAVVPPAAVPSPEVSSSAAFQ